LALLALAGVTASSPVAAQDCPVQSLSAQDIAEAIRGARNCRAAYDLLGACRFNAGADIELAEIVIARCEKTFLPLKPKRARAYTSAQRARDRKYAKAEGTMYASAQMVCKAAAAVRFSK
jgi:hypothetical protein